MVQLRESDIPLTVRIGRIADLAADGCTDDELETDVQVALSILALG
jgi:hypothetical protein